MDWAMGLDIFDVGRAHSKSSRAGRGPLRTIVYSSSDDVSINTNSLDHKFQTRLNYISLV